MSNVTLNVVAILNQTDVAVTVTPVPPPNTPPIPIPVPPGGSIELPPDLVTIPLIEPPVPPTPQNAMSLTVGSAALLLYTDGSGSTFMTNAVAGAAPVTLDRESEPQAITLQVAPDTTPGDISAAGLVPLYNVSLV